MKTNDKKVNFNVFQTIRSKIVFMGIFAIAAAIIVGIVGINSINRNYQFSTVESYINDLNILHKENQVAEAEYRNYVEQGYLEERIHYPFDNTQVGKGKKKRSKAFNLLKRLSRHADVLTFFLERDSSLFTNNDAEREIRNVKIKSKVQGAFRSDLGSEIYCRVRGYIATMKKNGQNQYEALKSIFELCDIMLPVIS